MTDSPKARKPDIIGIVKELQERRARIRKGTIVESIWKYDVIKDFPAIAQALLISVEALEGIEKQRDDRTIPNEWVNEVCNEAAVALSRIRSLPPL